jgi:hypothetical protein
LWKKVNQPFKAMCKRMNDKTLSEYFAIKERIKEALETIKSTQDFLDKQRLGWHQNENRTDDADKFANTYFEAQKALLEKLKKTLEK